jgi:uncharacterized membrane protein
MKTIFSIVFLLSLIISSLAVRCWVTANNNNSIPVVYNARVPAVGTYFFCGCNDLP